MKFKNKLLIIPDIHTHYEKAIRIINKYNSTHKFIFMGDYFDQFKDTPELNGSVAAWLKQTLTEHPDWIYLYGNHDIQYHPSVSSFCSGFSSKKKHAINSELSIDDWDKLKFFHQENGYWFSHAGITDYWFKNPVTGKLTVDTIQSTIDNAFIKLLSGDSENAIWASSYRRGGKFPNGSLLWEDFRDIKFIENVHQIVGHTPIRMIKTISDNTINSSITNVDNSGDSVYMTELLEIDENGFRNRIDSSYL